jgi:hypothetical protein
MYTNFLFYFFLSLDSGGSKTKEDGGILPAKARRGTGDDVGLTYEKKK